MSENTKTPEPKKSETKSTETKKADTGKSGAVTQPVGGGPEKKS